MKHFTGRFAGAFLALGIAGASQAVITITSQSVVAHCDGFAADGPTFGSYNHGVSNGLVGSIALPDSDAFTAGGASVSSSGYSSINYTTMLPNSVVFHSEGDYNCAGNGGGSNTTSLGSGSVNLGIAVDQLTAYDITVQILDVGNGGFTLYGAGGVGVGFGAGVGTYHFTGTMTAYPSYYWDMNGSVNDSTSGVAYSRRARMIIDARFTTVPEPSAWIGLALGTTGLLLRSRKRK